MKVVYVSSILAGGPLSHLLELAPRVASTGRDVKVLCATDEIAGTFRGAGIESRAVPLRHLLDLPGAVRAWPELEGADVVHTHDRRAGLLARPAARLRGAASVHTLHGLPEGLESYVGRDDLRLPIGAAAARLRAEAALSRLGTVVAPSNAMARVLVRNGFPRGRVRVIPNGVAQRRSAPGPGHDPVVVGAVAKLEPLKGIDTLLHACAHVRTPFRLEVFGDGSARADLERIAAGLGIDARFQGWVTDLPSRLEAVDVFVLPTKGDNLPVAILEAMALALPVVSTRIGGVPELVVEGETGILVEPGDARALGGALQRLVVDPALRETYGKAGARRVAERYDARDMARQMVELYEELANGT